MCDIMPWKTASELLANSLLTPNELRDLMGVLSIPDPDESRAETSRSSGNCRNCGAPVRGARCEYCGTCYNR